MMKKTNKNEKKAGSPIYFFPYSEMPRGSRVIIYGAGGFAYNLRIENEVIPYYEILYYVDKNYSLFKDAKVYSPSMLSVAKNYDYVVVASVNHKEEMLDKLRKFSVSHDKIKFICLEQESGLKEYIPDFSDLLYKYYTDGFDKTKDYLPYFQKGSKYHNKLKKFFDNKLMKADSYNEKMRAIHYLVFMDEHNKELFSEFCRILLKEVPIDELGGFCTDFFGWSWSFRDSVTREYIPTSREINKRYIDFVKNKYEIDINKQSLRSNTVAVIVYHFMITDGVMSGPTLAAMATCRMLKEICGYEVELFIEDSLTFDWEEVSYYSQNRREYIFPSGMPLSIKNIDDDDKLKIKFYGFNINFSYITNKEKRIVNQIADINALNPRAIVNMSGETGSLSHAFVGSIPLINSALSGAVTSLPADISIGSYSQDEVDKDYKFFGFDNDVEYYSVPVAPPMFNKSSKIYTKKQFGINDDRFLFVTVGVGLSQFINEVFIDMMLEVLKETNSSWMIIGSDHIKIDKELIENKSIILIPYENELSAIYSIADIYVNPPRKGGGLSIAEAIDNELPVLMNTFESDGMMWLGKENTVRGGLEKLKTELISVCKNIDRYNEFLKKTKERKLVLEGNKKVISDRWKNVIEDLNERI